MNRLLLSKEVTLERIYAFWSRENGQATTEYLVILVLVGLVCIGFAKLLPEAIGGYVRPIYYSVAKPFP